MLFVGDSFHQQFATRTKTRIRCALGSRFYMLLFSDNSALLNGIAHSLCFVVPVHYPSFVKSVSRNLSVADSIALFEFSSCSDRTRMQEYIHSVQDTEYNIVRDLELLARKKQ